MNLDVVLFNCAERPEWEQVIREGLIAYNRAVVGSRDVNRVALAVVDGNGRVCGGLLADSIWGWLLISTVWVDDNWRGEGLGARLLSQAEMIAAERGCRHVALETFSFQARAFYEKFGYCVYGELADFPPGHTRFSLKKDLL